MDELIKEGSQNILIKFLDGYFGRDELVDPIDKFEDFENFERGDKQCIRDYIASFYSKHRKLEKLYVKLSPEILAFKLLRNAKLSKQMRMLVLTGINFSNRNELYEDTKCSLQKFVEGIMEENVRTESATSKNKKKLFGNNLMKQTYGDRFSKLSKNRSNRIATLQCSSYKGHLKKINPIGANGKPLLCVIPVEHIGISLQNAQIVGKIWRKRMSVKRT